MKKGNRSVERTREMLFRAYAKLESEKDAERITVSEVTDCAGLSRNTFYLHFFNIDALRDSIKATFEERFNRCIDEISTSSCEVTPVDVLNAFSQFLSKSEEMCKWLLKTPHYDAFLEKMKQIIIQSILLALKNNKILYTAEAVMLPYWLASSMVELYTRYLQGELACTLQQITEKLIYLYDAEMKKISA